MTENLLIIEDNLRMRELLEESFRKKSYHVVSAGDGREAIMLLKEETFSTIVTDLKMPHVEGMKILEFSGQHHPDVPVIVITGYGTIDSAIEAMKKGAYDYIQKPFEIEELMFATDRAVNHYRLIRKNRELSESIEFLTSNEMIGYSQKMKTVKGLIKKVAPLDIIVLIQGETGTGKELVSRLIHQNSHRSQHPYLPINCGAITESLLESELFGYEKGAFTGAGQLKKGFFEKVDGGTLFLDEINNMSQAMQIKLLRFFENKRFIRVGGTNEILSDIRIIGATNVDLKEAVEKKKFRKDLFYRLNVFVIKLPALKEIKEDIPELSYHFLRKNNMKHKKNILNISDEALKKLMAYGWPGNIRELSNVIERSVIMEANETLTMRFLPDEIKKSAEDPIDDIGLEKLEDMEKFLIKKALIKTANNRTKASQMLGIDTSTLWRKIKRYEIESP
jgi:DNA-binding NtrC family response regulator